jgi:photosystem II stability/assembly factor-like uncharacterized protein
VGRAAGTLWIAGEQGLLLHLDPSTQRFTPVTSPYAGSFFGLLGSNDAVLAFGLRGNLWRSQDAGKTWDKVETGLEVALTSAARSEDGRIAVASAAGQVMVSSDGGKSFAPMAGAKPMPTSAVAAGARSLVLVGALGARLEPLH